MKLAPYRFFDGRCEAAFSDSQRVRGGRIEAMLRYDADGRDLPGAALRHVSGRHGVFRMAGCAPAA